MKRTTRRWIPAVLAPVLVASVSFGFSVSAQAAIDLPDKSASQVLQLINTNTEISFSGTVVKKADMGLPPMNIIPDISQSMVDEMSKNMPKEMKDFIPRASAQGELALALEFLSGTHRANVFVDGPNRARVQVLDLLSERNFIRNGQDLWFYDAGKQLVRHSVINPADEARAEREAKSFFDANATQLPFDATSPAAVADYFLAQAGSSTTFTVGKDAKVAGRGVYQLIMQPRTTGSLVDAVTFSVDAATGLPLAVEVKAVGKSAPAFSVAFESLSFEKPSASVFAFTAPAGSKVEEMPLPTAPNSQIPAPSAADKAAAQTELEKAQKAGWSAVLAIPADKVPAELAALMSSNVLYNELTKPVAGGRLFTTTLINVYFANDGRIFVGAVTPETLYKAASQK